ncbi:MAG: chaperone modulator CbpM [Taibaiella sp.]|nr:chaperone modulator CbpM [Taibaiella sp.]
MTKGQLIPATTFCLHHEIEISFIDALYDHGLIEVIRVEENVFISEDQVGTLEQFVRLYYDLEINLEGIEAITHLLERLKEKQDELLRLKNQLRMQRD